MTKNTGMVLVLIVVIALVAIYLGISKQESAEMVGQEEVMLDGQEEMMETENEMMESSEETMVEPEAMTEPGAYEEYSPEKLALANTGDVVLFFRASWCPTCRGLDSDIKANSKNIPAGVTILDVNYDTATALKQKYGVTYQHTLVQVDSSGNQIAKWTGSPTLASLVSNIK